MSNHYRTIGSFFKRPKFDNNSSEELSVTGAGPSISSTPDNPITPPTCHAPEPVSSVNRLVTPPVSPHAILNRNPASYEAALRQAFRATTEIC